jgi:hypothetical protein
MWIEENEKNIRKCLFSSHLEENKHTKNGKQHDEDETRNL